VPVINVISVTHVAGDLYDIEFDQLVGIATPSQEEPNMIFFSPGSAAWFTCTLASQTNPTTIRVSEDDGDDDCTLFAMMGQPLGFIAAYQFATATPIAMV
jgi:hypothetical protein